MSHTFSVSGKGAIVGFAPALYVVFKMSDQSVFSVLLESHARLRILSKSRYLLGDLLNFTDAAICFPVDEHCAPPLPNRLLSGVQSTPSSVLTSNAFIRDPNRNMSGAYSYGIKTREIQDMHHPTKISTRGMKKLRMPANLELHDRRPKGLRPRSGRHASIENHRARAKDAGGDTFGDTPAKRDKRPRKQVATVPAASSSGSTHEDARPIERRRKKTLEDINASEK
ncbi:hypothetical protein C8R44DRAFT_743036 [Mycena epipterygia]|nr:hypothetical protein C8R44DRAFT_743036 [Mycena epipterygia]